MCHAIVSATSFHALLWQIDLDLLAQAQAAGCPHCGGVLHRADYPRKPWGVDARIRGYYERRLSLCCERDGCRCRVTPATVRFLGRRRYTAIMMVLLSALSHSVPPRRCERLRVALGVSRRTLTRWRAWWREAFVASAFWQTLRVHLGPTLGDGPLPAALLQVMPGANRRQSLLRVLLLLAPWSSNRAGYPRAGIVAQNRSVLFGFSRA